MATAKNVALDLGFLRNWVRGAPHHDMALRFFLRCGFTPIVTPIVDAAITELTGSGYTPETRRHARRIQEEIADSIIEIRSYIRDVDREANDLNGSRVAAKGILQGACESDAILLAEAAFFDASFLLTPDVALGGAGMEALTLALLESGFPSTVNVVTPRGIADYLYRQGPPESPKPSGTALARNVITAGAALLHGHISSPAAEIPGRSPAVEIPDHSTAVEIPGESSAVTDQLSELLDRLDDALSRNLSEATALRETLKEFNHGF